MSSLDFSLPMNDNEYTRYDVWSYSVAESIGKRILLVEDEALIAMAEKTWLEEYGYSVHHVSTGEKAVQTIIDNSHHVDLILMDINLGAGIDGTQAAEQILAYKDIPVVFLSSHTEPEVVEKTEKITSYGYVVKNSGIVVLDTSIKMALKLFDARNEYARKEAALQESEKRFYELFERAPLGYQSLDSNGRFLAVNQAWCETLGYTHEDVLGKWFGDFLAPEYVQAFRERFPLFVAQGRMHSEFYMVHKSGEKKFIVLDGRIGHDADGHFKQTHCILKDETERRQAEEALLASKEQLATLSDNIPGGMVYQLIVDPQGNRRLAYVSSVVERLHGVTQAEALENAQIIYDQVHQDDIQKLLEAEEQAFSTLNPFLCEARIKKPDGEIRWLQLRSAISKKPDGTLVADGIEIDITERKRMEDALNESMTRYQDLVALIPVGVYIVWIRANGQMDFEYVSDRWCAIHGLRREDVMTDASLVNNMVHPDDRESFLEHNREAACDRKPFVWEGRFHTGEGALRWLQIESNPVVFDNSDIRWFGVTQDITERKRFEQELTRQKQYLETILSTTFDGFGVVTPDRKITDVNAAYCRMSGYSLPELTRMTLNDLDVIESPQETAERMKLILDTGSGTFETKHRRKDGTLLEIEVSASRLYQPDGVYVVCFFHEITEHKRVEEDLRRSRDLLDRSQRIGRVGGWEWDVEKQTMTWTNETYHIHGITPGLLKTSSPEHIEKSLACYDMNDRPLIKAAFYRCATEGVDYDLEFQLTRADDGERIWVRTMAEAVKDGDRVIAVLGNIIDITKKKKAEEEIKRQLAEKETLLREVHHRVKNNIAIIESLLSLQVGSTVNPEVKATLQDAISRVQSMRVLYDRLLLSRDLDEISIKTYVESLLDSLVMVFDPGNSITIEKHIVDFEVDAGRAVSVGIIINELLTNVFKYAFKDRATGTVSVSIEKTEKMVTIIIQDNGIGIDEKILETKSHGFGLTIVKMLAAQLEGTYTVVNKNGTWSSIQFEI